MTMPHFWALYMRKVKTCKKIIMCNLCLNRVTHKISTLTFDSTKFEKSGSQPIAKHTYCFTYENGNDFILPCISDSGNARTLVTQDILDDNAIAYYKADADKHSIPPNRVQHAHP